MTDEKRKRIIAAATVGTVLLIAFLAFMVVYQIFRITTVKGKRDSIKAKIEQTLKDKEAKEGTLEYWQSDAGLEDLAYEYGFVYGK